MFSFYLLFCCSATLLLNYYIRKWTHKNLIIWSLISGVILSYVSCYYNEEEYLKFISFIWYMVLINISLIDVYTLRIPNSLTGILFVCALANGIFNNSVNVLSHILGMVSISLFLFTLCKVKADSFGFGDIKLCAADGLYLGLSNMICAFIIAVIAAGIAALCILIKKKKLKNVKMPFGPFLCFGFMLASLYGECIVNWYFSLY